MSSQYRNNHYVPQWYQRRFIPEALAPKQLHYLDLSPGTHLDSRGVGHPHHRVRKMGVKQCFAAEDLYTAVFDGRRSTELEQQFFGEVDSRGAAAAEYFHNFEHPSANGAAFQDLLLYLSTQKLRTPKGLAWLASRLKNPSKEETLGYMHEYQRMHCAIWSECVWQLASAAGSETQFIVSDHPVSIYNRRCGPRSDKCRGAEDPDIRLHGSHTLFPLSHDTILILTNLSWVRNPYQSELRMRPHPRLFRDAVFNFQEIQVERLLSEQEVIEINFIIKQRAWKYLGAAQEEWLYPEKRVSRSDWRKFGYGYLLMPDPRGIFLGGDIHLGFTDGSAQTYDEYGQSPLQQGYNEQARNRSIEADTLTRFQGEFARINGPSRRGRAFNFGSLDPEQDDEEQHAYRLRQEKRRGRRRT